MSSGFPTRYGSNQPPQLQRPVLNIDIARSKIDKYTFQIVNNKGADQTVQMRRLFCAFVVHTQQSQVYLCSGPYHNATYSTLVKSA